MSQFTLSQIEEGFSKLPISEQRGLIDRLVRRVNEQTSNQNKDVDDQLAQMAADPDIQREVQEIEREFAPTDSDGLVLA
jgi:hypothetical protein